jgi:4-hydroxybenzoate polyprenyltransferase
VNWSDALKLGRVSNLPTVWTNTLAAVVLAGGTAADLGVFLPLLLAMSLFYVGGMYLNDAFDAEIDARQRPERAIPSGRVTRSTVFTIGFAMLAAGVAVALWLTAGRPGPAGMLPGAAAVSLAAAIVFYDWYHKTNPLSPVVMGLCRALVYVTAGLAIAVPLPDALVAGALLLLCYLIGLTYVAKQENLGEVKNLWPLLFLAAPVVYGLVLAASRPVVAVFLLAFMAWLLWALSLVRRRAPGDIPRAVVSMLAGICLFDALVIAGEGQPEVAIVAVLGFGLTLLLQRYVPGT